MSDQKPKPLFTVDPGWLFVLAGLATIAMATLVPAQRDLQTLRSQLDELTAKQQYSTNRLAAYSQFLDELEQDDEALFVRLAASQLNRRPEGDQPVLLAGQNAAPVTDWIDSTVRYSPPSPRFWPDSTISRLSAGGGQLWLLAGGALAVFTGMLLTSVAPRRRIAIDGDNLPRLGDDADETQEGTMTTDTMTSDVVVLTRPAKRQKSARRNDDDASISTPESIQSVSQITKPGNSTQAATGAVGTAVLEDEPARNSPAESVSFEGEKSLFDECESGSASTAVLDDVDWIAESDTEATIDAADDCEETWCGELEAMNSVDAAGEFEQQATTSSAIEDDEDEYDEDEDEDDEEFEEDDEEYEDDDEEWEDEEDEEDEGDEDEEEADEEEYEEDDEEEDEEDEDEELEEEWEDEEEDEDDEEEYEDEDEEDEEDEEDDDLFLDEDDDEDDEEEDDDR